VVTLLHAIGAISVKQVLSRDLGAVMPRVLTLGYTETLLAAELIRRELCAVEGLGLTAESKWLHKLRWVLELRREDLVLELRPEERVELSQRARALEVEIDGLRAEEAVRTSAAEARERRLPVGVHHG
jgi:hypothetical protein